MEFSIIIPVYNIEDYIECCIESIFSQTFKNFEVIAVNDGSSDRSGLIIKELQKKYKNLIYLEQENSGPGSARNLGIKHARGKFILFCDGDDFYTRDDALYTLYSNIWKVKDIMVFPVQHASNDDMIIHMSNIQYENIFSDNEKIENTLYSMLKNGKILSSPYEQLIRRDYLTSNDLFFPEGVFSEDIEWIIRIMKTDPKISFLDFQFYCYRWNRPGSTCNKKDGDLSVQSKIVEFINKYYREFEEEESRINILILNYLAYHWCVSTQNVIKLNNKCEQRKIFDLLNESKNLLHYNIMKKVKIFYLISLFFGFQNTAKISHLYYLSKRKIIKLMRR